MASLQDKAIKDSYKDLLTVAGTTSNEGLESTAKRVFDGEGVGSPLYLGTNTLDIVGTTTITGNTTMTGNLTITGDLTTDDITADDVKFDTIQLRNQTDDTYYTVFRLLDDNSATFGNKLDIMTDVVSKGTITLNSGTNIMVLDPDSTDQLVKGDGTQGKVSLTDTEVILKKDTKELLKAKEDGTIRFQSVNALPSNPSNGDIVNKDGEVFVAKPS